VTILYGTADAIIPAVYSVMTPAIVIFPVAVEFTLAAGGENASAVGRLQVETEAWFGRATVTATKWPA
jgi:hypothetical protein